MLAEAGGASQSRTPGSRIGRGHVRGCCGKTTPAAHATLGHPVVRPRGFDNSDAGRNRASSGKLSAQAGEQESGSDLDADPLFLFACALAWRRDANLDAGWQLVRSSQSPNPHLRNFTLDLLAHALVDADFLPSRGTRTKHERRPDWFVLDSDSVDSWQEMGMKTPYGMEIVDTCQQCRIPKDGRFCNFSPEVVRSFSNLGHHSVFPSGSVLFV